MTKQNGQVIKPIERLKDVMAVQCKGTSVELRYISYMVELEHEEMHMRKLSAQDLELSTVGSGVRGGFKSMDKVRVVNYNEVVKSEDIEAWKAEIKCEKERSNKFDALTPVKWSEVPKGLKTMPTSWVIKKKVSGKPVWRLNA